MTIFSLLIIALIGILILLLMIIKFKIHPFVALLIVSLFVAIATGIPLDNVVKVVTDGLGGVLGSVAIIIGLGAMLGQLIERSGGAENLAIKTGKSLGAKKTIAALTIAGFILGIPVFFDVGFIILAPIIYGFAKVAKISPLKYGLPIAGVMLTVHVALPPHPGPVAAAGILHADVGLLTLIGFVICIPVAIIGYYIAKYINRKNYHLSVEVLEQLQLAKDEPSKGDIVYTDRANPPKPGTVIAMIVIPILIIMLGTVSSTLLEKGDPIRTFFTFIGSPIIALLIALILAVYFLALRRNWTLQHTNNIIGDAIPAAAVVIMITGAGGVFGKVLVESGVGKALSDALAMIDMPIIVAAFIISLVLRASQGSATVAILTTGGLLSEAVMGLSGTQLVLVTLASCFGGLGLSHVNDSGFWIVTRYLGLSVSDGLKTWTVLTTLLGLLGFLFTGLIWMMV